MSSNSVTEARKFLQGALVELLPEGWLITDVENAGESFRKITVTYEQGDITSRITGAELPRGVIGLEFSITVLAPEQDSNVGLSRVSEAAMDVAFALDSLPQVVWDGGTRVALTTGQSGYRFPVTVLVTYSSAPEEE